MTKEDFLRELAYMLQDVAEEEREEALAYYRDYLEDAGPEAEQEVLQELGTPAQVAAVIKAGLNGADQGEFSEKGYGDPRYQGPVYPPGKRNGNRRGSFHGAGAREGRGAYEPGRGRYSTGREAYEPGRGRYSTGKEAYEPDPDQAAEGRYQQSTESRGRRQADSESRKMSGGMIALLVVLCILASPMILGIGLGLGGGILGLLAGAVCTVLGLMLAVGGMALGFLVGGIICLGGGIFGWYISPLGGAVACFVGLALLGLALLTLALAIWFYGTAVPALVRWIGRGFRKLFGSRRKGGETA